MRILITGASGFIGTQLTRSLQAGGHQIIACTRQPKALKYVSDNVEAVHIDFNKAYETSAWLPLLNNIDVVINAVGIFKETRQQTFNRIHAQTPSALFQACELAGVKRVIQISALGTDDTAFSPYHLSKLAADNCLQQLELDWVIVKPSIVYSRCSSSMNFFKAMANLPIVPIIENGQQQIQPIHIDDFCKAIRQMVSFNTHGKINIDMVGPEPISIKELYSCLHQWLGKGLAHFISIPYSLTHFLAFLFAPLTKMPISADAINMLRKGNTADVQTFIDTFGFRPKSVEQIFKETPAQQTDRWHAGLYFLNPLLRFAIAFLWIYTGFVSAFVYPVEQSYKMLAEVGITEQWQPVALYSASLLNILFGLFTLVSYRLVLIGLLQITVIILYSILITFSLPEQWLHPFGPVSKNIPIIISILIMMVLSKR